MSEIEVFRLERFGRSCATREKGRAVFSQLRNELSSQRTARPEVVVDWSGVNLASPSFIDEFISLLCSEEFCSRPDSIIFAGSNGYIAQQIHAILLRRGREVRRANTPEDAIAGRIVGRLGKRTIQPPSNSIG